MNNTTTTKYKAYYVVAKWKDADGNGLSSASKFSNRNYAEKFVKEAIHNDGITYEIVEI